MAKVYYSGPAVEFPAAEAIGGHRVVAVINGEAFLADKDDPTHLHAICGITFSAFGTGDDVCIQIDGPMIEASWSWTPQLPIYLGNAGVLTQTPPSSGNVVQVAVADTATKIRVNVKQPIVKV